MPGAFKLDHLQPVKPILFSKFSNFFTFILEKANSYYPRERKAENRKMEISQPEVKTGDWVPGAFKLDLLQLFKLIWSQNISSFYQLSHNETFLSTSETVQSKQQMAR